MNELVSLGHVKTAISDSLNEKSKLNDDATGKTILQMDGMSSYKVRHLLNNLCNFNFCNYLEVGAWKGSTFCSALHKNKINATCIEDWSQYGGPRGDFFINLNATKGDNNVKILEQNCFTVVPKEIGKINIYFYDGLHNFEAQSKAITYFREIFDDRIVIIVDDFQRELVKNDPYSLPFSHVRDGTHNGLYQLFNEFDIVYRVELPPFIAEDGGKRDKDYWCGLFLALLERKI